MMLKRFMAAAMLTAALPGQTAAPPKAPAPRTTGQKAVKPATLPLNKPSLNKPALEAYLRHVLMWPAAVEMTLGDPTPSIMPGYFQLKVRGTSGGRAQDETFYVSADSQIVIHGDIFDVKTNPFQADINLMKTDDQPSLGIPGAPVTVVEFSDFQCPYCKQESRVVRAQLMAAYPTDVQLFFMDYPLEASHPYARGAAILGRCIYRQNNASFWAYHDWMFEHQGDLTPDNLRDKVTEYARGDKNLDAARLATCAAGPEARQEVDRTIALGDALKLTATPTVFVNGRRMVGTVPMDDLKMVVDHEIAYAKSMKKDADCCSVQLALPGTKPAAPKGPTTR